MQIHGARRWSICPRGLEQPPSTSKEAAARGCALVMLRRGDALYLPSKSWHWAFPGPGLSAHLVLGVLPLVASDLLIAAGAQKHLAGMGHSPLLGEPLPLWAYHGRYEAAAARPIAELCRRLPWKGSKGAMEAVCSPTSLALALQRLVLGFNGPRAHAVRVVGEASAAFEDRSQPSEPALGQRQTWQGKRRLYMLAIFTLAPLLLLVVTAFTWLCCMKPKARALIWLDNDAPWSTKLLDCNAPGKGADDKKHQ
ncbi:unnamed protein product [Polarella glacialis]|uniref:JmjC domain-containing protein n=1 Tax=Polarella glacialis TaxID=89957 RepID=A0A813EY65_POLGL|nr:unnamed protein product [Polarella glacialis]